MRDAISDSDSYLWGNSDEVPGFEFVNKTTTTITEKYYCQITWVQSECGKAHAIVEAEPKISIYSFAPHLAHICALCVQTDDEDGDTLSRI